MELDGSPLGNLLGTKTKEKNKSNPLLKRKKP
jgi:hypothetical protein